MPDKKAQAPELVEKEVFRLCPCPFCGSTNLDILSYTGRVPEGAMFWFYCRKCGAAGPQAPDKSIAQELWNGDRLIMEKERKK